MANFLYDLFFSRQYLPHGNCYLWQSKLFWLHLLSDALIALAYYSIILMLIYLVRQLKNIPFKDIFFLFNLFLFSYGTIHILSIWTLWQADYGLSGLIKVIIALLAVYTVVKLSLTLPKAVALPASIGLEAANQTLKREITRRQQAEIALQQLNLELEQRVKQRTQELKTSEQKFRSLFEAASDFIYILNLKGQIQEVNPAVIEQSGYAESELVNHKLIEFLSCNSQPLFQKEISLDSPQTGNKHEIEFVCKDNTLLTMDCSCTVVRNGQNEDAYILVWLRNISDRKINEQYLTQINEELVKSNQELEQFAYVASHDLREPLRMVTSFTQLLAKRYGNKLDGEANKIIGFAVDGATRMEELIDDLLEYSRLGQQDKFWEIVDCETVLDLSLHNLNLLIQETHAEITRTTLPTVLGNQGQLVQLFQNLIDNGIVYRAQESPKIEIGAEAQSDQWLFWVKDNGIGINPKYQERIFQIFQRLHTRQEYPGTGIGLAICHKIVERHGGKIWVESKPQQGATFYFTLGRCIFPREEKAKL